MTEENAEYNMAEDLLRDLDSLVEYLEAIELVALQGDSIHVSRAAFGVLLEHAQRARKIAQVYYDRVK